MLHSLLDLSSNSLRKKGQSLRIQTSLPWVMPFALQSILSCLQCLGISTMVFTYFTFAGHNFASGADLPSLVHAIEQHVGRIATISLVVSPCRGCVVERLSEHSLSDTDVGSDTAPFSADDIRSGGMQAISAKLSH